ncbi:PREDICTED: PRUPE_8G201600 [Prunus dulcis]|uniref:PREDICTED: PRUPE_8G201600 n=1 Tax=Prunus dulcis TaxID=3755 RepID=A0A5E4EKB0_PRUDU|nr:PREDICTED: PRUPE_8G201600 [Prunus dulcis]
MIVLMREGEAAGVGRKGTTEVSREKKAQGGKREGVMLSSDATSKQGFFSLSLSLSSEHRSANAEARESETVKGLRPAQKRWINPRTTPTKGRQSAAREGGEEGGAGGRGQRR